jgi:RND family efflux transporter MFP subunit
MAPGPFAKRGRSSVKKLNPLPLELLTCWVIVGLWNPVLAQGEAVSLVRVDAVRTEPLVQTVSVIGRLVARQAGSISSRIDGPVRTMRVQIGERVTRGQIIAELDTAALEVQHRLAEARFGEVKALLATRKAELDLARQDVKRLKGIKNPAVTSRAVVDDAVQNVVISTARVSEAMAAMDSALASVQLVELGVEHTQVRAPYAGVIVRRSTEAGAYVKTGETVAEIIADGSLEVEADIPFDRLSGVPQGTVVRMLLDDGSEHSATVRAIVPQEDPLTRTRATRFVAEFKSKHGALAVDQSVTLHIPVGARRDVLSVHKDGIIRRQGKNLVYVVSDDIASIRTVQLGDAVGSRFEVLSGLEEGELVVVRGNERLQPDAKVAIDGHAS